MFGKQKKPIRNDLMEAYGPKRAQSIGAYHLLPLVQDVLGDWDEKPTAIVAGTADSKPALLVLTNERVFLLVGNLFTRDVTSLALSGRIGISQQDGILTSLVLRAAEGDIVLQQAQRRVATDFVTALRRTSSVAA